jgi:hypothetical protein
VPAARSTQSQLRVLEAVLDAGPAASGWSDQCCTSVRIADVVRRRFGVDHTLAGLDLLLHRIGWSVQIPARKATEREDEDRRLEGRAVARHKRTAADLGAWICFEDEAGQGLRPPKGRTWGRRGHIPAVRVTAAATKRVSMATLICTKPGHRERLIYRVHLDRALARTGARASPRPTTPACSTPPTSNSAAPVVLVWDNLNVSRTRCGS